MRKLRKYKSQAQHLIVSGVRQLLIQMINACPLLTKSTTKENTNSEMEVFDNPKHRKTINSAKIHMAGSMVIRRITLPYDLVYTVSGQPVVYEQLTLPLFVTRYMAVIDTIKPPTGGNWSTPIM